MNCSTAISPSRKRLAPPAWAALLERFYRQSGLRFPRLLQIQGEEMPQPYRSLLVHSSDMTPTLETFYQQPVWLTVLGREREDNCYLREVVLHLGPEGRRVEYGVIRIHFEHLPSNAVQRVLEEHRPLGNILQTDAIAHMSWPQAFFRAQADAHMRRVLEMKQAGPLYGRRNVLLDGSRRLLADVIEVLAPAAGSSGKALKLFPNRPSSKARRVKSGKAAHGLRASAVI